MQRPLRLRKRMYCNSQTHVGKQASALSAAFLIEHILARVLQQP